MARGDNRFDRYQRTHAWIGVPVAVIYKLIDDQGVYLAALMAYYGFLSLFPLLLLGVSLLGFALSGNPGLQAKIVSTALADFPVVGTQIEKNIHAYTGSVAAITIGVAVAVYGSLGVAQATQNAMNVVWAVPRNLRPNPIRARLRSIAILGLQAAAVLGTTALSTLATGAHQLNHGVAYGKLTDVGFIAASTLLNVLAFLLAFKYIPARAITTREVRLGAIIAGVVWESLQLLGTYYTAHKLKGAREVYGVFALVLGLIGWIYIEAIVVVLCAELNVVLGRRLWPRAVLTPFTDEVDLTSADQRAYGSYAKAQRFKGREEIKVSFRPTADQEQGGATADPSTEDPPPQGSAPPPSS